MEYNNYGTYANITDEEWVEKLVSQPPIQPLHYYFFKVKCSSFLQYIAKNIYNVGRVESLLGEFYEFLSCNDWYVLRSYKGKRNASLSTYLSRCSFYYFAKKKRKIEEEEIYSLENEDILEQLSYLTNDETNEHLRVWKAFACLNERDRKVLKHLVIDGRKSTDVAEEMWPYVQSKEKDWRKLPVKRVQDTLAMMKRRALFGLIEELKMQPI